MPDDLPQSLFSILREDIANVSARLDKLVTTDSFRAEQRRRDELHAALGQDLVDERLAREKAIAAEAMMRDAQVSAEREARVKAHQETDQRSRRAWGAVRWTLATVIALGATVAGFWALFVR